MVYEAFRLSRWVARHPSPWSVPDSTGSLEWRRRETAFPSTPRFARWRTFVLAAVASLALTAALVRIAGAAGNQTTACVNLCPDLGDPCVVGQNVTVIAGSTIDCGTRAVQLTGGDLVVHDGRFTLKAKSFTASNHTITADCPQLAGQQGFTIQVTDF